MIPEAAAAHYLLMQRLQMVAVLAGRRAWDRINPDDLTSSWMQGIAMIEGIVAAQQVSAAVAGSSYIASALAEQGEYEAPDAFINPAAFGGTASDGRPLRSLLYSPVTSAKSALAQGKSIQQAMTTGRGSLDTILRTTVADAGRAAAGVDIASRDGVGYVRMLNPPSCGRCSVLAGKFYRWNRGFARHPHCDCVHVPSKGRDAAESEGLMHDPYEYFHSLSPEDQRKYFGVAESKAINDGADLFQVVNAQRGMKAGGVTTEGTGKRGNFRSIGGGGQRLTPEAIYEKGLSRVDTMELLRKNGYILPGGQNPEGSIVGQREGFGALGHGGERVGVRNAVLEARRTGVRDPAVRATMTEAERLAYDAQTRWDSVRDGQNPFNPKKPLTPEIAARVEREYRKYILGF